MVTEATTRVLAIIVSLGGAAPLQNAIHRMKELLEQHASASDLNSWIVS